MIGTPIEKPIATNGSSNLSQSRDSCGEILQRKEFMVTVEYCNGHGDKGHYGIQQVQ